MVDGSSFEYLVLENWGNFYKIKLVVRLFVGERGWLKIKYKIN